MHFLHVNVTYHDAVKMIHDVIGTANPFPYTAKFMRCRKLELIKVNKPDVER